MSFDPAFVFPPRFLAKLRVALEVELSILAKA
jgi:hypothetical protein